MSCMISISENEDEMWMINNSIYSEFIEYICNQYPNAKVITEELIQSVYINGLAFDEIEDKIIAKKISTVLKETAKGIVDGIVILVL